MYSCTKQPIIFGKFGKFSYESNRPIKSFINRASLLDRKVLVLQTIIYVTKSLRLTKKSVIDKVLQTIMKNMSLPHLYHYS